jgi:carbonic anhydrase
MMSNVDTLLERARAFRSGGFVRRQVLFDRLVREGQSPKFMIISCSDSRVDPAIIFDAEPGEIFMVRSVANLVPPNAPGPHCHSIGAALEFGVTALGVEHVIVLGHSQCGGVDGLLRGADKGEPKTDFIGAWLGCASAVRDRVVADHPDNSHEARARTLEYETVRQSVRNLSTYPWVDERVRAGTLQLHGWHFDIAEGALSELCGGEGAGVD